MIDPLSIAADALTADVARLTSISQNLVNAATPGYRREISFATALQRSDGSWEAVPAAAVDQRRGTLRATGEQYDLAIDGDGFFELRTPGGPAYTRRGDFHVDEQGRLVTAQGYQLEGLGGPVHLIDGSPVVIDRDGVVTQGDQRLGQVKVVAFDRPDRMTPLSGELFQAAEAPRAALGGDYRIRQGYLEASNVDTAAEMVRLMETMRHFEATQKLVQGVDDMSERTMRKLGEF